MHSVCKGIKHRSEKWNALWVLVFCLFSWSLKPECGTVPRKHKSKRLVHICSMELNGRVQKKRDWICKPLSFTRLLPPLVSTAITEYRRLGGLETTNLFLTVWETVSPRSRHQLADSVSGESPPPDSLTTTSFLCPYMVEGTRESSGVFFIKALIPFWRAPSSWPNHLPKALPPNTIALGGDTNILFTANGNLKTRGRINQEVRTRTGLGVDKRQTKGPLWSWVPTCCPGYGGTISNRRDV